MEIQSITALISSVGFPIACCITCFWYIKKITEEHKADTEKIVIKLTESHKEEIEKLTETIENNTNVMLGLMDKLKEVIKMG